MAGKIRKGDKIQYVFKRAGVLAKPEYVTVDVEQEAHGDKYAAKIDKMLAQGINPFVKSGTKIELTVSVLIDKYLREATVSQKTAEVLSTVQKLVGKTEVVCIDTDWVDQWVAEMKRDLKLAPSTIRAKVESLARCTEWGVRKKLLTLPDNPLRTLPDGYAQYTEEDSAVAGVCKIDTKRERRLELGEFEKIMNVINNGTLPRKYRPYTIKHPAELKLLIELAIDTAMRLREMYTLSWNQVNFRQKTIHLERTKNGDKRHVPMSSVALRLLTERRKAKPNDENVFPWWDGRLDPRTLKLTSNAISKECAEIFELAGCVDLRFHDLRHEGTSRLFELTDMECEEIMKITGHKTHSQMMRYLNLRGSKLASRLW